jgi:hypothetical protein
MLTRPKLERREHVCELTRRARPPRPDPSSAQRALARTRRYRRNRRAGKCILDVLVDEHAVAALAVELGLLTEGEALERENLASRVGWRTGASRSDFVYARHVGGRSVDRPLAARFRTIQAYPKDLRALPEHPKSAVSWHGGFRGGAHARP